MSDTKAPGDKKIGVGKTLTLKPRTETGVVRQSFSHGRSKQVVVETVKRRTIGKPGEAPKPEPVAEQPAPKRAAPPAAKPTPAPAPKSGVVLRTLTDDERNARAHALADARVREAEERKIAEAEARRRQSKEGMEQAEREAAETRKREEEERHRREEEAKRKAELEAKKRSATMPRRPPVRRASVWLDPLWKPKTRKRRALAVQVRPAVPPARSSRRSPRAQARRNSVAD